MPMGDANNLSAQLDDDDEGLRFRPMQFVQNSAERRTGMLRALQSKAVLGHCIVLGIQLRRLRTRCWLMLRNETRDDGKK